MVIRILVVNSNLAVMKIICKYIQNKNFTETYARYYQMRMSENQKVTKKSSSPDQINKQ